MDQNPKRRDMVFSSLRERVDLFEAGEPPLFGRSGGVSLRSRRSLNGGSCRGVYDDPKPKRGSLARGLSSSMGKESMDVDEGLDRRGHSSPANLIHADGGVRRRASRSDRRIISLAERLHGSDDRRERQSGYGNSERRESVCSSS